jgi:hypothetical protein
MWASRYAASMIAGSMKGWDSPQTNYFPERLIISDLTNIVNRVPDAVLGKGERHNIHTGDIPSPGTRMGKMQLSHSNF